MRLMGAAASHVIVVAAILAAFGVLHGRQLNHDISWFLVATGWWIDGLPLYSTILEVNPPLAFYLTAPAVLAARMLGVDPTAAMLVWVLLLVAAALLWSVRLMRLSGLSAMRRTALVAALALALIVAPLTDFGQRDHFLIVFTLPWLVLAAGFGAAPGAFERAAIGALAGIGVALKPVFVVLPVMMVALACIRSRSLRPLLAAETVAIVAVCAAYLVGSILLHPEYFTIVVPTAVATYGAYSEPLARVLGKIILPMAALLLAILMLTRLEGGDRAIGSGFVVAGVAGMLTYALQAKGWSYQAVPFFALSFVASAWIATALAGAHRFLAGALLLAAAAIAFLYPAVRTGPYKNAYYRPVASHFVCPPGQRSFHALGTNVWISYPLANFARAEPAGRAPALWTIPGAVRQLAAPDPDASRRAELSEILDVARDRVVAEFVRAHPQLAIVDVREAKSYFGPVSFDYLSFLQLDDRFRDLWTDYRRVGTVPGFDIYRRDGCP